MHQALEGIDINGGKENSVSPELQLQHERVWSVGWLGEARGEQRAVGPPGAGGMTLPRKSSVAGAGGALGVAGWGWGAAEQQGWGERKEWHCNGVAGWPAIKCGAGSTMEWRLQRMGRAGPAGIFWESGIAFMGCARQGLACWAQLVPILGWDRVRGWHGVVLQASSARHCASGCCGCGASACGCSCTSACSSSIRLYCWTHCRSRCCCARMAHSHACAWASASAGG